MIHVNFVPQYLYTQQISVKKEFTHVRGYALYAYTVRYHEKVVN